MSDLENLNLKSPIQKPEKPGKSSSAPLSKDEIRVLAKKGSRLNRFEIKEDEGDKDYQYGWLALGVHGEIDHSKIIEAKNDGWEPCVESDLPGRALRIKDVIAVKRHKYWKEVKDEENLEKIAEMSEYPMSFISNKSDLNDGSNYKRFMNIKTDKFNPNFGE